jgi:hypothetical protein
MYKKTGWAGRRDNAVLTGEEREEFPFSIACYYYRYWE